MRSNARRLCFMVARSFCARPKKIAGDAIWRISRGPCGCAAQRISFCSHLAPGLPSTRKQPLNACAPRSGGLPISVQEAGAAVTMPALRRREPPCSLLQGEASLGSFVRCAKVSAPDAKEAAETAKAVRNAADGSRSRRRDPSPTYGHSGSAEAGRGEDRSADRNRRRGGAAEI